ncbi:peptidase S8/S53 domain-containing protein [Xylariales sp. AK1849]|nr:peptidase S8/S53 domain-containing protein [Xylariales sp. AK1849]
MFVYSIVPAVLALAGGSLAFPSAGSSPRDVEATSVFESIEAPPQEWIKVDGKSDKTETLELRIQLAQTNMAQFQELALNIATPGHDSYGKHMSLQEIDAIIAPKPESSDLVFDWLNTNGLDSGVLSTRGNVITVNATVSEAEKLLGAQYATYTNTETGATISRALNFSLPASLMDHIATVQPTTFFGLRYFKPTVREIVPEPNNTVVNAVTGCTGTTVDPKCLSNLYNFASVTASVTKGKMGITGFIEQYPSKTDLATFLSKFAITANTGQSYTCTAVNSGKCPASDPGDEANLDVQYARAITSDIPNEFYSTGGDSNALYDPLVEYLLALDAADLPNTISTSYGGDESSISTAVATNTCNLFSQLGARGVSILFASGDSGVGSGCTIGGKKAYQPDFPGGCPWVTMVGGTSGNTPEKAWTDGGGGFSNKFTRPTWQTTQVASWLASNKDGNTAYYNSAGRGYPDVAAAAVDFEIVLSSRTEGVSGTSCASPTFASVIQLVNSNRVAAGKKPLGFLNPWLYGNATAALTDITSGSIGGCAAISGAGFTAIKGWDPATGLGSPNYAKLLQVSNAT